MSWVLLGALLALAAHAVASSAAAALVCAVAPAVERRLERVAPAARARGLFALALAPSLGGVAAAVAVVSSWVAWEPRGGAETAGPALWSLAFAGVALVASRLAAGLHVASRTSRAVRGWTRGGTPLAGLSLPATRIAHPLPVAALAGFVRPRLLLASRLVDALDPDELRAVAAHESGHAAALDNLRRLALAASPDPLAILPAGRRLRAAFEEAAEAAADRRALRETQPLTLARALVAAAALVPEGGTGRLPLPLATLEGAPLAARVRALLAADPAAPVDDGGRRLAAVVAVVLSLAAPAAVCAWRPEPQAVLEAVVRALS